MKLLLVEDSSRLRGALATGLRKAGYALDVAADGTDGLWRAESTDYDVIVLDIMLPGMDGLSVLTRLREQGRETHVLLLTAKDTVDDRVQGLRAGADDYLVKPFAFDELLARVEALCRRSYGKKQTRITLADLEIDLATKAVRRLGHAIKLKPRQYALLEYMAFRLGEVVTRRDIEAHLYNDDVDLTSNVVNAAMSVLRKSLAIDGAPPLIRTLHGIGYVLDKP